MSDSHTSDFDRDLLQLRALLTLDGVRALASAQLEHLELMQDDRTHLQQSIALALGDDRVPLDRLATYFIQAARGGIPSPEAVLQRLYELDAEVPAPEMWTRRKPGPPKGRKSKISHGGPWTPQTLRSEMARLKISQRILGELFSPKVSDVAVNKWLSKGIPDLRQEELSRIFEKLEPTEH